MKKHLQLLALPLCMLLLLSLLAGCGAASMGSAADTAAGNTASAEAASPESPSEAAGESPELATGRSPTALYLRRQRCPRKLFTVPT